MKFNKNTFDKLSDKEKEDVLNIVNDSMKNICSIFNINPNNFLIHDLNDLKNIYYFNDYLDDEDEDTSTDIKDTKQEETNMTTNIDKDTTYDSSTNILDLFKDIFDDLIYTGSEFKKNVKKEEKPEIKKEETKSNKFTKKTDKSENNINNDFTDKTVKKNYIKPEIIKKLNSDNYKVNSNNKPVISNKIEDRRATVKKRLLKEAAEVNNKKYEKELKDRILNCVDDLLLSDEHHYKIYTTNNKPSVELSLNSFPIYLKEHYYILNDMITIIKDAYNFEDVFINIVNTEDKDVIDLKIYMVL